VAPTTWIRIAACGLGLGLGAAGCSASGTKGSLFDAAPTTASDEDGPYLAYYGSGLAGDGSPDLDASNYAPPLDAAPSDSGAEQ
jgi:hypothetical protein